MDKSPGSALTVAPGFCIVVAMMLLVLPLQWVMGWLSAIAIHEFGHFAVLKCFRKPIQAVSFELGGIYIKTEAMTVGQEILCALAGPLFGLCPLLFARVCPHIAVWALVLSGFNMLPVLPMDGGRVTHGLLRMCFGVHEAFKIGKWIGIVTVYVLGIILIMISIKCGYVFLIPFALLLFICKNMREKFLANKKHR